MASNKTRTRPSGENSRDQRRQTTDELNRLDSFLTANHHNNGLTVKDLALGLDLHIRKLQRLVADSASCTPSQYLRRFRLERASKLLLEGYSVTYVALHVGFKNPAHFSTRFREHFELSPTAYVNHHRQR